MGKRIKVRFNLGRGKNYLKWKIQYPSGVVKYIYPISCQLVMKNCQLKNSRKTAEKIFNGENKTVCAWVLCDDITVKYDRFEQFDDPELKLQRLKYNPKRLPFWTIGDSEECIDGATIDEIGTVDYKLFITKI
jgi:hypothetical protein